MVRYLLNLGRNLYLLLFAVPAATSSTLGLSLTLNFEPRNIHDDILAWARGVNGAGERDGEGTSAVV